MENNELYADLLGLANIKITDVSLSKTKIDIFCETTTPSWKCLICKEAKKSVHQRTERSLRNLNMGIHHVYLHVTSK